jgi:hypothetical protein
MDKLAKLSQVFYGTEDVTAWQGIRKIEDNNYIIVGTSGTIGRVYIGPLDSSSLSVYDVNFPGATATSVYGPDYVGDGVIRLVGTYKLGDDKVRGFYFMGTVDDLTDPTKYQSILTGEKFTYIHSIMGDVVVGNRDNPLKYGQNSLPLGPGCAFVYDLKTNEQIPIKYPEAISNTAYGVWHNGGHSYTICGGYSLTATSIDQIYSDSGSLAGIQPQPFGQAYLVNYDSKSHKFSDWTSFIYPGSVNFITHFQGISGSKSGGYQLSANSAGLDLLAKASWVSVHSNFKVKQWVDINYPGTVALSSSNSVAGKAVVGIVIGDGVIPFQVQLIN